jgi:hypothetical protein
LQFLTLALKAGSENGQSFWVGKKGQKAGEAMQPWLLQAEFGKRIGPTKHFRR